MELCVSFLPQSLLESAEIFRVLRCAAFLLDQSKEYVIALALSVVEFWLELFLFGQQKRAMCGIAGGAVLLLFACIMWLGQITRSVGMATAGFAFTHQIQDRQRQGHELVTHGIYSILRHPGYTGWFYASIATQCVLCNPVCAVLYCWAAWRFFARRIPHEEYKLYTMFGQKYLQYRYESFVLIPFIPSPLDVLGRGKTD